MLHNIDNWAQCDLGWNSTLWLVKKVILPSKIVKDISNFGKESHFGQICSLWNWVSVVISYFRFSSVGFILLFWLISFSFACLPISQRSSKQICRQRFTYLSNEFCQNYHDNAIEPISIKRYSTEEANLGLLFQDNLVRQLMYLMLIIRYKRTLPTFQVVSSFHSNLQMHS